MVSLEPTVNRALEKVQVAVAVPGADGLTGTVQRAPEASEKVTVPDGVSWLPRPMPAAVMVAVTAWPSPAPYVPGPGPATAVVVVFWMTCWLNGPAMLSDVK